VSEVFEDATGINRCEVRVRSADGPYPAMVRIEEVELDGDLLAPDAKRLADILSRAAHVAEQSSRRSKPGERMNSYWTIGVGLLFGCMIVLFGVLLSEVVR
jgi:hypothetical protein